MRFIIKIVTRHIMIPLLQSMKEYFPAIKRFHLAIIFLIASGVEDTVLTAANVAKYGLAVESNPLLRSMIEHFGIVPGLAGTKMLVSVLIIYTAHMMNKTHYKVRGEYLLYGGSICWLYGAATNLLLP
jgi:hypothetical protein